MTRLQSMLFTAPAILLAIVCHEYAHGWVSDKLGDPTPRQSGRLTLNPLKHLNLLGVLCMLIFHVGWANPVPINPSYYKNRRTGLIATSLAGPAANLILAFLSLLLDGLVQRFANPNSLIVWLIVQLLYASAVLNVGLALFNLIPIPPLDGSRILGELVPQVQRLYWKYQRWWQLLLLVCLFTGILSRPLSMLNGLVTDGMWNLIVHLLY